MNVLILGGTRLMGRHLTRTLLEAGHRVTLGNRGQTPDSFGGQVERLTLNRLDGESLSKALSGREYDVICDSLAYSAPAAGPRLLRPIRHHFIRRRVRPAPRSAGGGF